MSKKKKKTFKRYKAFAEHLGAYEAFSGVSAGAAKAAPWSGYAVALGAIESIVAEGKSSKKVAKRYRKTVKNLHRLAKHAGGKKAVRPPAKAPSSPSDVTAVSTSLDEAKTVLADATNVNVTSADAGEAPAISGGLHALAAPRNGRADDLKLISGIGPKLETLLHGLGVFHFDQIARWTPDDVVWVDEHLRFSGRITREDWVAQADALAAGDSNEYVSLIEKQPK